MKKIKLFSKFFLQSKYTPVENMFTTICCVTVSLIKMGLLKEGGSSPCGTSTLYHFFLLCLLPEDGRMESQKLFVVEATK